MYHSPWGSKGLICMNSIPKTSERLVHYPLPEMRVLLFEIPLDPSLQNLKEQISLAGTAGFNGVLIPFMTQGLPLFPSRATRDYKLPLIRPDLKKKGEMFYELFDAASTRNLPILAYVDPLQVGDARTHVFGPILRRHKSWGAMNKEKKYSPIGDSPHELFLCVNNSDVRRFAAELLVEIVESFPVSALVLDLSGYPYQYSVPEQAACFCDSCQKSVKDELNMDLMTMPLDMNIVACKKWKKWKEDRLLSFISYVSTRVRKSRIDIPVFLIIPGRFDTGNGSSLLDGETLRTLVSDCLVTSLIVRYSPESPRQLMKLVDKDLALISEDALLLPLVYAENERELADYLLHLRPLPIFGSFVSLAFPLADREFEALFRIPYTPSSLNSSPDIFRSIRALINYILSSSNLQLALNSFLQGVIHYLDEESSVTVERTLDLVEDFRTIEQKFKSGDLDTSFLPPETLRHISLIRKLLRTSAMLLR